MGRDCSAHLQVGVGAADRGHDADLEIGATKHGAAAGAADAVTVAATASDTATVFGFLIPGLLGRWNAVAFQRPSVAPSAWSLLG